MDKKIFVIIGLIGLAGVLLFMLMMSADKVSKGQMQVKNLEDQKSGLAQDLDSLRGQNKQLQDQVHSLNGQLEGFNGEKAKLQEQMDGIVREKNDLLNQINGLNSELAAAKDAASQATAKLQQQASAPAPVAQAAPAQASTGGGQNEEYWARLLREKTALELRVEDLNKQLADIKSSSEKTQHDRTDADQELSVLTRENDDVKRELDYNKKIIDALTLDLAREKNNSYEIQEGVKSLKAENKTLRSRLKSMMERKQELETGMNELKDRNVALEASLEKMQLFVKAKLEQMDSLKNEFSTTVEPESSQQKAAPAVAVTGGTRKEAVQLPPIVVHPQSQPPVHAGFSQRQAQPAQPGEAERSVLAVNKENNFVIINKGSANGIHLGDTFKVFDPKKQLAAEVEVIQVRENIAAADIKKELEPLKVGFSVR